MTSGSSHFPKTKISYFWPSWWWGVSCQTEVTIPFWSLWNLPCRLVSDVFFPLFVWKYITIKGEPKGQIEGRYCSFTASTLSKVPSSPSLSAKCLVLVVFFANMFVVVDVVFSFGTSPKKHINGNPRVLVAFLPGGLGLGSQATIVFLAGSQTQRVWHLSRWRQLQL